MDVDQPAPRWACILCGDPYDLATARHHFGSGERFSIEKINLPSGKSATALLSPNFQMSVSSSSVYEQAGQIVATISGILFSLNCRSQTLKIENIRERNATGDWGGAHFMIGAGEIRFRGRSSLMTNPDADDDQQAFPRLCASMAGRNQVVTDVLQIVSHHNRGWFGLYIAYERMRDDINKTLSEQKATTLMGWPSEREQSHFRQSSNVYRHSKSEWGRYTPDTAMSLPEARQFVSDCLRIWLKWRAERGSDREGGL